MSDIEIIYQQTIMDYSRDKKNKHEIPNATGIERGHNPSCGDDLTVSIREKDGLIEDAAFSGVGCAVSTASTNMVIDLIKGKTIEEGRKIIDIFFKMMAKETVSDDEKSLLGDAELLEYFSKMPARIKCATLSWHGFRILLEKNMPTQK